MASMNISLPEGLREFVEEQVELGDYASVSEYMRELVRRAKGERDLEDRLLSALGSEDLGELDSEFFSKLKATAKAAAKRS